MIGKHVVIDTLDNFKTKLDQIPSSAIVLIKDVGQIYAHGTYFGAQKTYSLLTKTADGLAPKGGTSASSQIKDGESEWVLTVTNGENPTWRKLPDNAFSSSQYTLPSATASDLGGIKVGQVYTATFDDLVGQYYKINVDKNGLAYVHVPWINNPYTASGSGITLKDNVFSLSLNSVSKLDQAIGNKIYAVSLDKNGKLCVSVPWVDTNNIFTGATETKNGSSGMVPAPIAKQHNYFLKGDGTWVKPNLSDLNDDIVNGKYLPLSGGTMGGDIVFQGGYLKFTNTSGSFLGAYNVNDSGEALYLKGSTWNRILHSGNYSNYALPLSGGTLTGTLVVNENLGVGGSIVNKAHYLFARNNDDADWIVTNKGWNAEYTLWHSGNFTPSNYLPLSGGTLDGVLTIRAASATRDSWIEFSNKSNSVVHKLGVRRPEASYGLQYYNGSEYYKIWHEGNDGDGSGLEADTIGTYKKDSGEKTIIYGTRSDNSNIRRIYDNGWNLMCQNGSDNGVIATLKSNVASATKLQTARTIWGQSFDGTGNIDGDITATGALIGKNSSGNYESYVGNASGGVAGDGALMYAYGSRNLYFYTKGTCRMFVNSSGNVGIGTTSPTKKLHIYSDSSSYDSLVLLEKGGAYDVRFELANSIDALRVIQQSSGNAFISLNGNHSLNLETSNTVRFTIDGSGNVGIGTASPQQKLHVNGHIWSDGDIGAQNKIIAYGNIIAKGNIGVGTESPAYKLDVNGDIATSQYLRVKAWSGYGSGICSMWYNGNTTQLVLDSGASLGYNLDVNGIISANSSNAMSLKLNSSKIAWGFAYNSIGIYHSDSQKGGLGWNSEPAGLSNVGFYFKNYVSGDCISLFNEGGIGFIGGNIGIGTASPVHKLDVNGTIYGSHYYGNEITFYTRGNGTYTRAWITAKDSAGDFIIEAPLTTESASGTRAPITLTWRGGYPAMGGLKITGYSEAELGKNKIWHAGNDGSGSGLNADLLDGYHISVGAAGTNSSTIYFVT